MKALRPMALGAALFAAAPAALALGGGVETEPRAYFGAGIGFLSIEGGSVPAYGGPVTFDDSLSAAFELKAGMHFNEYVAGEASLAYSNPEWESNGVCIPSGSPATLEADIFGVGLHALVTPVPDQDLMPYAKLSLRRYSVSGELCGIEYEDSYVEPGFGVGLAYDRNDDASIRLEAERVDEDAYAFMFSATMRF